jgi:predicted phage terminase large subunit-like protein
LTNLTPESQQLLLEWQRRQGILRSLNKWAEACGYQPATHHRLINSQLERVERGELKRLAIFLPPGSAKSTYASVLFPPHYLAQRGNRALLACSHSTDLAESFGRRARNVIDSHSLELGYSLSEHSKAAGRWEVTNGGSYFSAGVGVGIAGYRADLGLIDDPLRNKEDADSKLIRDKQWDWYNFDFKPRLKPGAAVVLIQTRWHEDDLAGRILANEGSDWEVLRIPFYAEENDPLQRRPGEMLWPEWFKDEMFPTDPRVANALYQNNPTPEAGNFYQADWIDLYTYKTPGELPKNLRWYVGSDHAVSLRQEADFTCCLPGGYDSNGELWIPPNIFWEKADSGAVVEAMLDLVEAFRPVEWWAESGHISKSIGPFLNSRMRERKVYFVLTEVVSSKDKPTRAQPMRGRMKMGKVHFPAFASWWPKARHQLLSFPVGDHDDFVDALSELGQGIDKIVRPSAETIPDEKVIHKPFVPTFGWLKEQARLAERALIHGRYNGR